MKPTIVILHGWGASIKSYDKLKLLLEQKGISVFVFDLPGFGSEPAPAEAWSVDDYADWVEGKMKAVLGEGFFNRETITASETSGLINRETITASETSGLINRETITASETSGLILYGHSFGGRIAIKLAARQIEGVKALILCDAAGVTPRPKSKITFFSVLSQGGKMIFSLPLLRYFQPLVRKIEYFLAGSRDYYYLQNEVMKGTFRKVIEEDLTGYLAKIKISALIIWGRKDRLTPVSDAYILNEGISGSEVKILEETGHSPHLERPEELAGIIEKFIKK
jgi:pimeloyl-ACP methyl ester carboxylesterase